MNYVALLRGINVGGNSKVSMIKLKEVFESYGFLNVKTYINSGNVIFESSKKKAIELENDIEGLLEKTFFPIVVVVISEEDLNKVIAEAPKSWKTDEDLRKYVGFMKSPSKPEDVVKEAQLKEGIDFLDTGPGVIYMTTKMEGITKSNFSKLAAKKIYKQMTIRNINTALKLSELLMK